MRRLILLNYFRAEAERKNSEERNVIYAIEEPETSQHPDWQVELFNALVELSENPNTQVLITTHSPSLAGLVCPENILFVYKNDQGINVKKGGNDNLQVIADTLGLLPNVSITVESTGIKAVLCVEGPSDIEFFNHISKLFGIDLENDGRVLVLCLGGGTLMHWVNKNYLAKLNKPEVHIYDNDVSKYQLAIDEVNARDNGWGTLTNMYEMENYIHPSLISQVYPIQEEFFSMQGKWQEEWGSKNVPKELSTFLKQLKANGNTQITDEGQGSIKRIFSSQAAPLMTVDLLKDLSAFDEVNSWFERSHCN